MTASWKTLVTLVTMVVAANVVALTLWIDPPPRLIWNASPSVPIGFYRVYRAEQFQRGDLAVVAPPADIAAFLANGGYLPMGLPLIKPVAALPGQVVCRTGDAVSIDGQVAAIARGSDRLGRPLPRWQGCRTLASGELFFLNAAREDSLDGRYFGPLPAATVIGRAAPL